MTGRKRGAAFCTGSPGSCEALSYESTGHCESGTRPRNQPSSESRQYRRKPGLSEAMAALSRSMSVQYVGLITLLSGTPLD